MEEQQSHRGRRARRSELVDVLSQDVGAFTDHVDLGEPIVVPDPNHVVNASIVVGP